MDVQNPNSNSKKLMLKASSFGLLNVRKILGCLLIVLVFDVDLVIAQTSIDSTAKAKCEDCEVVFRWVSEMPQYTGEPGELINDVRAALESITCKVPNASALSFIVNTEGKMVLPIFKPGERRFCSNELEKQFETFSKWIPGKQDGIPVCVEFSVPLNGY